MEAPKVTIDDIEANIASESYFSAWDGVVGATCANTNGQVELQNLAIPGTAELARSLGLLTFCVLTTKAGFTVSGESACVSHDNFSASTGREMARKDAVSKLWGLMGYALKEKLAAAH